MTLTPFSGNQYQWRTRQSGVALMLLSVVFVALSTALIGIIVATSLPQSRISRDFLQTNRSFFAAESGLEDVAYRVAAGLDYSSAPGGNLALYSGPAENLPALSIRDESSGGIRELTLISSLTDTVRSSRFLLRPTLELDALFKDLQVGYIGLTLKGTANVSGQIYSNSHVKGVGANTKINLGSNGYLKIATPFTDADPNGVNSVVEDGVDEKAAYLSDNDARDMVAQQFVPSRSGHLEKVRIQMRQVCANPDCGGQGEINVKIMENVFFSPSVGNIPSTPLLVNEIWPKNDHARNENTWGTGSTKFSYNWRTYVFSDPPIVEKGKAYWLVLDAPCAFTTCNNYYVIRSERDETYASIPPPMNGYSPSPSSYNEPTSREPLYKYKSVSNTAWFTHDVDYPNPPGPVDMIFEIYIGINPTSADTVTVTVDGAVACPPVNPTPPPPANFYAQKISNTIFWYVNAFYGPSGWGTGNVRNCPSQTVATQTYESSSPPPLDPPLSPTTIDAWIVEAKSNGYCSASYGCTGDNYSVTGAYPYFPREKTHPAWVKGNFTLGNFPVAFRGYTYIEGDLNITGGTSCNMSISNVTGDVDSAESIAIIVKGKINISGACEIFGHSNGTGRNDHLVLVSKNTSASETVPSILVNNTSQSDLFHSDGMIVLKSGAKALAIYGEGVVMENSASLVSFPEGRGVIRFKQAATGAGTYAPPSDWGEK